MREPEYKDFPPGSDELWNLLDQVYASKIRWGYFFLAKIPGSFFFAALRILIEVVRAPVKPGTSEIVTVVILVLAAVMAGTGWLMFLCYRQMTPLRKGWRKADSDEINFYHRHGFEIENVKENKV